jgi:hypothetical protein
MSASARKADLAASEAELAIERQRYCGIGIDHHRDRLLIPAEVRPNIRAAFAAAVRVATGAWAPACA